MVSFQCEGCGDVLTKKKLDAHTSRCRNASFTCLDCHTQFWNQQYKAHTSCITEAEKYQGRLYKQGDVKSRHSKTPHPATVEDLDKSPNMRSARTPASKVPPRAPTPPSATPPINVFDYLVQNSKANPAASSPSPSTSSSEDSISSVQTEHHNPQGTSAKGSQAPPPYSSHHEPLYTYGSGPVEPTRARFDSTCNLNAQLQQTPYTSATAITTSSYRHIQTPGSSGFPTPEERGSENRSARKRKRSPNSIEEASEQAHRSLQTGLTGGLHKLLSGNDTIRTIEVSPLSPKKRAKHSQPEGILPNKGRQTDEHEVKRHREASKRKVSSALTATTSNVSTTSSNTTKDPYRKRHREAALELIKATSHSNATESDAALSTKQLMHQSHSEFFLTLIDKDHRSVKGQSIWGTLKTFHDNRKDGTGRSPEQRLIEEKRLLKGLRCKINKQGEIVLFSRPEAEED